MTADETKPLGINSEADDTALPQDTRLGSPTTEDVPTPVISNSGETVGNTAEYTEEEVRIFALSHEDDDPAPRHFDDTEARALAASCEKFSDLPIDERVQNAIAKLGWVAPTPVQKLCLPFTLKGREVAGFAQTGTGKTGVFLITTTNKLLASDRSTQEGDGRHPRAIVLAPTRELAMQIEDDAKNLLEFSGLSSVAIFGGVDYEKQATKLREGVDVIVATPGRLMDYTKKGVVDLKDVQVFVCDEADRMFDMGFIEDVEFFLKRIPESAQKLLFSATTNEQVKELAFEYLESPEYISVNPEILTPEKIEQRAIHVHAQHKLKVLMGLMREQQPDCSIIFTNTKLTAEWLWFKLSRNGFEVDLITGDLPQKKRIRLIERIKRVELKALIATDVASRGLHISRVTHVYNFDLPEDPSNYVHRIGRTARAGARGTAISLVCDDYGQNLTGINTLLGSDHALTSVWFDEAYLKIEDKAGNPFQGKFRQKPEKFDDSTPRGRTQCGRQRVDSAQRHQRGSNADSFERNKRADRGHSLPRHSAPPKHKQGTGPNSANFDANEKRNQGRHRRARGQHEDSRRSERHQNGKSSTHDTSHERSQPKTHSQASNGLATQPKSFFGMLKALFLSIFGRKSK